MRAFVANLLALGLIVTPAMARTGSSGDKDSAAAKTTNAVAASDDKTSDKTSDTSKTTSTATSETPAKPGSSGMESELQQLRELLEAQARQIQLQNQQMKQQQERMEAMEAELKTVSTPRDTSYEPAPDSRVPKGANTPVGNGGGNVSAVSIGTADGQAASPDNPIAIRYKGITITPGGFLAAESIFRNKAMSADINTPFNSIPFSGNPGGQTTEFNFTARQSRLSMLAEGKLDAAKLSGYVETDFLGTGITSNDNESNSYVLRLRQGWGQAKFDSGFSVTGGQMWSLITETKKAVDNRTEAVPLTIDPAYTVGFSWARQYGLRVAQTFGDGKFTVAASVEEAATTLTVHGNPTITTLGTTAGNQSNVATSVLTATTFNNFLVGAPGTSGGVYNPTGTYAYNKTPDFVVKAVVDPADWGHFEVYGLISNFRDRVYPCFYANGGFTFPSTLPFTPTVTSIPATTCALTGATNPALGAFNSSVTGGGIGVNGRVSIHKKVDLGVHALGGDGIGRYGTAQLSDSTVHPDGTLALLRSYQALATVEFHPMPKLDIYAYVGGEYAGRAAYPFTNPISGKTGNDGYGSPAFRNDGCSVETLPIAAPGAATNTTAVLGSNGFIPGALSNCTGDARNIIEGTIGFWYRVYTGPKGRFQWGPQYSYLVKNTWSGAGSKSGSDGTIAPHAVDNMLFTSFRYYLP
ncbi:MAG: hypothetical protein WCA38_12875 [Candidatus Acidiferrales bacterium]